MSRESVKLLIPFEALAESVTELNLADKLRLWALLEEQINLAEEEREEQDPAVLAQIQEARAAYQAGDYVTLEEYVARHREQS